MKKRVFDITVSAAALVAFSPVLILTAFAILLSMGRPVLFMQVRPGLDAEPFTLLKFRTMKIGEGTDAERLTRLGKLLRRTSVDELPELVNILRGDMSLVGPRPLLTEYVGLYTAEQSRRHECKPGLTGLAQVSGRNALPWEERLLLDVRYVDEQSFALDLKIILKTVRLVASRADVSHPGDATMHHFRGTRDRPDEA